MQINIAYTELVSTNNLAVSARTLNEHVIGRRWGFEEKVDHAAVKVQAGSEEVGGR